MALARAHKLRLHSEQDALDVLSSGLRSCIFTPAELHPQFFDLSNQIAGTVFQKFVNYSFPIAIVIAEDHSYGGRIEELVRDHQRHPFIRFFFSIEDAQAWIEGISA